MGEFKTYISPSAPLSSQSFRFVMTSDLQNAIKAPLQPAQTFVSIKMAANPAFVLMVGDFDHRNPLTFADRKAMYHDIRTGTTPEGADFANSVGPFFPIYYMWDNHDWGAGDKRFTSGGEDHYIYRCAAWDAFRTYWPAPPLGMPPPSGLSPPPPPTTGFCSGSASDNGGMWYKFVCGKTHFIVLDLRSQKDPPDKNPSAPTMLGTSQMAWLKTELLNSQNAGARWIFLISSVSFDSTTKTSDPFLTAPAQMASGGWGTFDKDRNDIALFVTENNICNAIWLSGDLHSGGAADNAHTGWVLGPPEEPIATGWGAPEFGTPHVNLTNNPLETECGSDPNVGDSGLPRTMDVGTPCTVDASLNGTGDWWWGDDHNAYVSGYAADESALRPVADTYPFGGAGFLQVDVSWDTVTIRAMDRNGTSVHWNGYQNMEFMLDYATQCPRPTPPPDPEGP